MGDVADSLCVSAWDAGLGLGLAARGSGKGGPGGGSEASPRGAMETWYMQSHRLVNTERCGEK